MTLPKVPKTDCSCCLCQMKSAARRSGLHREKRLFIYLSVYPFESHQIHSLLNEPEPPLPLRAVQLVTGVKPVPSVAAMLYSPCRGINAVILVALCPSCITKGTDPCSEGTTPLSCSYRV